MVQQATYSAILFAWLALGVTVRADDSLDQQGIEYFETHIRPVLVEHCYECHSVDSDPVMGGLRLDSRAGLARGGDMGPALVAGSAETSLLIRALRQDELEMPPDGKLPDETIRRFAEWIRMGAPDPRDGDRPSEQKETAPDEPHWAFVPPVGSEPPAVHDADWPITPIDQFVLSRLENGGLAPVQEADRTTLIRRVYFDLWGLPPTPAAVREFRNDDSPQALENLIDRLMSSPRFGERWGRHWLDVARYGESTGHERNFLYPHAWRYREYVIDALNGDKSYDEFILEQVAGDLLPASSQAERDEQRTATGFLAIGPRNLLGSTQQFALDSADDQINVTMRAILGLTVSCARCHDHKFDPIMTEEYYSLAGIFLSIEELYGTQPGTGGGNNRHPRELVPLGPNAEQRHQAVLEHAKLLADATQRLSDAKDAGKKLASLPKDSAEERLSAQSGELGAQKADVQQELEDAQRHLEKLTESAPEPPSYAMGVRDASKIIDTQVRISGDAGRKGDTVPRGVLSCCTLGRAPEMPKESSGRLELAQWLVDGKNPLTARVAVNRIWHHLFGRGIVPTVDNFGRNGRSPSHPELLDWLALRFQQDGWSFKRMIRMMMLSRVYRLDSDHNAGNYDVDPDNELLWRCSPRRLEAEAIRDSMLAVSGKLEFEPPASGSLVAELGDGCLVRQIDADGLKRELNCRSVYLPNARYFEPEMLQVFDGAAASLVVGDRAETNVPAQALFLLNNEFTIAQSRLAAGRILEQAPANSRQRIRLVYQLALGRNPTAAERSHALSYLQQAASEAARDGASEVNIWAGLVQAIFASAEFRYLY